MDVLNENISLSLFLELAKFLFAQFAQFGAEPSAKAHFQFIIDKKRSEKHERLSAGKATVQHNRNSKAMRKQEVTEVSGTNQNYTKHKRAA